MTNRDQFALGSVATAAAPATVPRSVHAADHRDDMNGRASSQKLIRGATLITMDANLGDFTPADILLDRDRIAKVAPNIDALNAEVIDAAGRIVIPGLVNAHLQTWQTCLRGVAANWTLLEYFRQVHAGLATLFKPEDTSPRGSSCRN